MSQDPPWDLDVSQLCHLCQEEREARTKNRHLGRRSGCYELFRRALDLGDARAAQAVALGYDRLVRSWLRTYLRPDLTLRPEVVGECVQEVWRKLWMALGPDAETQLGVRFPSLGHVLAYLKQTTLSVAQDCNDKEGRFPADEGGRGEGESGGGEDPMARLPAPPPPEPPSEEALRLWAVVNQRITDPRELLYLRLDCLEGYSAAEILNAHPERFPGGIREVYILGETLIKRIRRWFPELEAGRRAGQGRAKVGS